RDVGPELALDDLTVLAAVKELDRVLEADDVDLTRLVQMIDHRRQGGGLAGAGGAGDEDHPLVEVAELRDDRRQSHLLELGHLRGNGAESRTDAGLLAKDIDPEAAAVR